MGVLAERGIDIYNTDKKGNNALHMSAKYENRYAICDLLVRSVYDLNIQNNDGDTAVHIAAQKGNLKHLELLIDNGAEVNILNDHSLSPLYLAVLNEKKECCELLMEKKAKAFFDGNDIQKDRSPIFLAIRNQNKELLEMMFEVIEDEEQINIKNSKGLTPMMFAAKNLYKESLQSLVAQNQ